MNNNRYSRQLLFPGIGQDGQKKLLQSKVFIVGMGALGTVLANHLVRAGVGHVRFVDRDFVEESNLQRQTLFDEQDVRLSLPKALAAEKKLQQINSSITVEGIVGDLTNQNIADWSKGAELILDGTDNFQTRFLINDYAFLHQIPYLYGGAVSSRGMQASFIPGKTPCLRCFIDDQGGASETCDTSGVIATVVDMVASYQATEALKILVGKKELLRNSLLSFDIWHNYRHELKWKGSKKGCPVCEQGYYPALQEEEERQITTLCGRETVQISPKGEQKWDLKEWGHRLEKVGKVELTPFLLRFYFADLKMVLFPDGRVFIQGTEDVTLAKTMYARFFGM